MIVGKYIVQDTKTNGSDHPDTPRNVTARDEPAVLGCIDAEEKVQGGRNEPARLEAQTGKERLNGGQTLRRQAEKAEVDDEGQDEMSPGKEDEEQRGRRRLFRMTQGLMIDFFCPHEQQGEQQEHCQESIHSQGKPPAQEALCKKCEKSCAVSRAAGTDPGYFRHHDNYGKQELDEERKAAMVSNLLVVLCGNHDAQPVVNSGSLY